MAGAVRHGLIGVRRAIPVDVIEDYATPLVLQGRSSPRWIPRRVVLVAAGDVSGASVGLYTSTGGGGTTLAAPVALAALSASGKFVDLLLSKVCAESIQSANVVYLRVTANYDGSTFDAFVFGDEVPA